MAPKQAKADRIPRASSERLGFRREMLTLSEPDRQAFFDALVDPPRPSDRLVRALAEHKRRIAR
jgi:hypothetical protein